MKFVHYCELKTSAGVLIKVVIDPTVTTREQAISKGALSSLDLRDNKRYDLFSPGIITVFDLDTIVLRRVSIYDKIFSLSEAVSFILDNRKPRKFRSLIFHNAREHAEWIRHAIELGIDINKISRDGSIISEAAVSITKNRNIIVPEVDQILDAADQIARRYALCGISVIGT